MQSAFSLRPRLVLWCGGGIVLARTGMLFWVVAQPEVFTNLETLKGLHPALAGLTPESMLKGLSAPLHPGAEKYYKEAGLM